LLAILRDARMGRWLGRVRHRLMPKAAESPPLDPVERRRIPWKACLVSTFGRLTQVVQYGVVLHAVGGVLTPSNAFVAHGIHLIGATLGDMLPNQVGVTDSAYRAFAADLGFSDEPARALSIAIVVRIAQLSLAAACVVVAALVSKQESPAGASPASAGADARS